MKNGYDCTTRQLLLAEENGEPSEVLYGIIASAQSYCACELRPFGSLCCRTQLLHYLTGSVGCEGCSRLVGLFEIHILR